MTLLTPTTLAPPVECVRPHIGPVEPIIKWAGGKRKQFDRIRALLPERFGAYYEPFFGGGAVFWGLRPERAHIRDINHRLIQMYRGVRDDVEEVIEYLSDWRRDERLYYRIRDAFNESSDNDAMVAARFIYLNKAGFNGLYRENQKGEHNVSFGAYPADLPTFHADHLRRASEMLVGQVIECGDFRTVWAYAKPGDAVYFDPPYVPVSETSDFTRYAAGGFGEKDQRDLALLAKGLKLKGVHVVLSNSNAPLVHELYGGGLFTIETIDAKRSINRDADKRGAVKEVLIR